MIGATGTTGKEAILFGGGPALCDLGRRPWTAAYVDSRGEPTADLRSNIAAEARAKIVYERLINSTDDPGIKEALGFLMTREVGASEVVRESAVCDREQLPVGQSFQASEEICQHVRKPLRRATVDANGPWNSGDEWDRIDDLEQVMPADGGDGTATVNLGSADKKTGQKMAARTKSDPSSDPTTGAGISAQVPAQAAPKGGDLGGAPDIESAPAMAEATVAN